MRLFEACITPFEKHYEVKRKQPLAVVTADISSAMKVSRASLIQCKTFLFALHLDDSWLSSLNNGCSFFEQTTFEVGTTSSKNMLVWAKYRYLVMIFITALTAGLEDVPPFDSSPDKSLE